MEPYILIENDIVLKMIAYPQLFIGYNERQKFCTIHQNIYSICTGCYKSDINLRSQILTNIDL